MGVDLKEMPPKIERGEGLVASEFVPMLNARLATSAASSSLLIALHRAQAGLDTTHELNHAKDRLRAAADALGFDLVRRA